MTSERRKRTTDLDSGPARLSRHRRLPVRRLGAALALGSVGVAVGVNRAGDPQAVKHGMIPAAQVATPLVAGDLMTGAEWDISNMDHDRVDYWVERFSTDKRDDFAAFLERSGRYAPMIIEQLDAMGEDGRRIVARGLASGPEYIDRWKTYLYEHLRVNTVVAKLIEYVNYLTKTYPGEVPAAHQEELERRFHAARTRRGDRPAPPG